MASCACGIEAVAEVNEFEGAAELEAELTWGFAAKSLLDVGMEGRWNIDLAFKLRDGFVGRDV